MKLGLDFRCIFRLKLHRNDNSGPALADPSRPFLGWLAQGPPLALPALAGAGAAPGRPSLSWLAQAAALAAAQAAAFV